MVRFLLLGIFISLSSYSDPLPVEAFGTLPAASQVKLSPNGQMLAYKGNLKVLPLSILKTVKRNIWSLQIIKNLKLVGMLGPMIKRFLLVHITLCRVCRLSMVRVDC